MKKKLYFIAISSAFIMSCSTTNEPESTSESIIIKGSDTEFELVQELAEIFSEQNKIEILVEGNGSSTGIDALIENKIDIANSSREMTDDELKQAAVNGVTPVKAIIAMDAIAFITHPRVGVDSLSTMQVQGILTGEIINWSQVGGNDLPIKIYGRNRKSGTYKFINDRFAKENGFAESIIQLESNKAILNAVKNDTAGIGYVGAGYLMDQDGKPNSEIWAIYLYSEGDKAYSPYERLAVTNGDYPIIRPLYQYFNGAPTGLIKAFLEFEISESGQEIVKRHGYFPISSYFESINKQNGIEF